MNWSESFPQKFAVSRSIPTFKDEIISVDLHVFGDGSPKGVSAVLYLLLIKGTGEVKEYKQQRVGCRDQY